MFQPVSQAYCPVCGLRCAGYEDTVDKYRHQYCTLHGNFYIYSDVAMVRRTPIEDPTGRDVRPDDGPEGPSEDAPKVAGAR